MHFLFIALFKVVRMVLDQININVSENSMKSIGEESLQHLRNIFTGRTYCLRHQKYKEGKRVVKVYNRNYGTKPFSDKLWEQIDHIPIKVFGKHTICMDYVMEVLFPELTIAVMSKILDLDEKLSNVILCGSRGIWEKVFEIRYW